MVLCFFRKRRNEKWWRITLPTFDLHHACYFAVATLLACFCVSPKSGDQVVVRGGSSGNRQR
ncbi:hypothetical protein GmHk_07G020797 [Glycine max]|nr:hypothetical protein GmHk_07G020797 [Glycine max]